MTFKSLPHGVQVDDSSTLSTCRGHTIIVKITTSQGTGIRKLGGMMIPHKIMKMKSICYCLWINSNRCPSTFSTFHLLLLSFLFKIWRELWYTLNNGTHSTLIASCCLLEYAWKIDVKLYMLMTMIMMTKIVFGGSVGRPVACLV